MRRHALPVAAFLLAGCVGDAAASGERPSILFVSLDTLRADRVGAYGNAVG